LCAEMGHELSRNGSCLCLPCRRTQEGTEQGPSAGQRGRARPRKRNGHRRKGCRRRWCGRRGRRWRRRWSWHAVRPGRGP
jgi:hypothetical protein